MIRCLGGELLGLEGLGDVGVEGVAVVVAGCAVWVISSRDGRPSGSGVIVGEAVRVGRGVTVGNGVKVG